jgi:hypothetical protein
MQRLILLWALVSVASLPAGAGEAPRAASAPADLDDATKERFLLEGRIVEAKDAGGGITPSKRATLVLDGVEHDAHIQRIDKYEPMKNLDGGPELDFRDSYLHNVAAYRLDRLLGLGMVPVSVVRSFRRKDAAFTWWVDDVRMDERQRRKKKVQPPDVTGWNRQILVIRVFDELIYNTDRNPGNLLIDGDWRIWMIDHTRAFKIFKTLGCEISLGCDKRLGTRCARQLLEALRGLDEATLGEEMEDLLSEGQIRGLLARRDEIVAYYDARIAVVSEAAVLYDLPSRTPEAPAAR